MFCLLLENGVGQHSEECVIWDGCAVIAHSDHRSIHLNVIRAALAGNAAFEVSSAFVIRCTSSDDLDVSYRCPYVFVPRLKANCRTC